MKKRVVSLLILFTILTSSISCVFAKTYIFPDLWWYGRDRYGRSIEVEHEAVREITQATKIGFIDGYDDGTFKPDDPIKRMEFVKMLIVLATNRSFDFDRFSSNNSLWWEKYVKIAEMQGIVDENYCSIEEWEEPITRIEAILMLAKTQIKMKGIPQYKNGSLVYTDIDFLTEDEKALVLHAVKYELLNEMKDGTIKELKPLKNFTRAEAAVALMRIY